MLNGQQKIMLSKYTELYELLIPKNHMLKQFNDLVDFSFVYNELASSYSQNIGRGAKDIVMMFKYLLLKVIYELSDEDVVERSLYDM
ncbi:transposase-like protein DUF772 [Serpentinicella alkaliphila]|uniref:Transposase-like protein DUF772 n=1 Tax=Serpentinicella alkaliphila TaxID=1734049 RepID=A0A4R2SSQ3_9FIRM|nr:transposase-like protein DUF772 [Serpentinicella alkaliphila]